MDPAGGTAAQNTTNGSLSDSASTKPELDMTAINEAIAQTANDPSTAPQQTFDVNEISLDNTPTTDAGLEQQQASNPGMNLANSGAAASATAAGEGEKPAAPAAAFVDGDIVDEAPKEEKPATKAADYDAALNADPLASFEDPAAPAAAPAAAPSGEVDPSTLNDPDPAPAAAPAAAPAPAPDPVAAAQAGDVTDTDAPLPAPVEKKDDDDDDEDAEKAKKKKKGEIHINFDFDKILHSNAAIVGIIVGGILILVAVLVIANL